MRLIRLLSLSLACALLLPGAAALAQKSKRPKAPAAPVAASPAQLNLKVTQFTLPNGLRVVLHEDHSTPMVAVNLWYHVGSKNETPGKTGFAHLFEHMMFQGSKNFNYDYFFPLQEAGGNINGSTTPTAPTTTKSSPRTSSRRPSSSRPTAWAGCSKR
jgi:zinc protease